MSTEYIKTSRVAAISDGIFAIAMTLLVLDLKLPGVDLSSNEFAFKEALIEQLPYFTSWLISFAILSRLWITHYTLLNNSEKVSRFFTIINFAFLCTISFIPFPSSLIGEYRSQPISIVIFSISFILSTLLLAVMYLVKNGPSSWRTISMATKAIIIGVPLIGIIACILAYWNTTAALLIWCIAPFIGFSIKKTTHHKAKQKTNS